jgi:hypothetical protein
MAPVIELGKDERGDEQILSGVFDQVRTTLVVGVGRIEGCQQWAGIEDQRH